MTVVFFLFNLTGSDPVQNLVGENANQEVVSNMRNKLRLNHSLGIRYLEYLNNLSPIRIDRTISVKPSTRIQIHTTVGPFQLAKNALFG